MSAQPLARSDKRRRVSAVIGALAIALTFAPAAAAWAHDDTSGAVTLLVDDNRVVGTGLVDFEAVGLIDTSGDGSIDADELSMRESAVSTTLVDVVNTEVALFVNGVELPIVGAGLALPSETMGNDFTSSPYVGLAFASEAFEGDVSELRIVWRFSSPSAAVAVSTADGALLGELDGDDSAHFVMDAWSTSKSFAWQGVGHIWAGPDHLLFLVVLTLGVVRGRLTSVAFWRVVKLVLAFTVGHAVSLALAYFGLVSVPASIVEPAIALSIVGAALLALRREAGRHRWWIAGAIGLVHGLGFASSLASLGLATRDHALALLSFNLGIDAAQTAVVIALMAVFALIVRFIPRRAETVRALVCVLIGITGLAWTLLRIIPGAG